ncbi:MAG: hypothetical protein HKN47_09550 [Pirellulaceae bacterium]|nr:hypothetical protein [Pirellulaceae bacterium]
MNSASRSLAVLGFTLAILNPLPHREVMAADGAEVVAFYGYDDCIRLSNDEVRVTLCPAAGGRVLEYSSHGTNVLYLPEGDEGWRYTPDKRRGPMNAGRFDIGPEQMVNRGPLLWMGPWIGAITGDREAKLTSQVDPQSGVRLTRTFRLAKDSSHLICTQTIDNVSAEPVSLCHWSRTFAVGNGIALVPRTPLGRFPNGYVMYTDGKTIAMKPEDTNIKVTESDIVIKAAPKFPKLGFDSHQGWLAYSAPTDQLFVKRFRTYRDRAYNEVAGLTISVWYPAGRDMVELEPIGPAEDLAPGENASFTEEWWLLDHPFPSDGELDVPRIHQIVESSTSAAK